MNFDEMQTEALRLCRLIDQGVAAMVNAGEQLAVAEHNYRKARAVAWDEITDGTAGHREALVDGTTADLRMIRDKAEAARRGAIEAVRARQGQLSALQTLMSAYRAEAEFVRTAP